MRNYEKSELYKKEFNYWKREALDEAGYFIIFQGFLEEEILKNISGNALKLYLYLGINSRNSTGVVWHSNKKIAEYFNKAERTIRSWMKELEDLKLIKRMRLDYDGKVYTYLKPYKYKKNKIED
ncbi:helix-turn-helix domain-containing protein [Clostridium baratii]|uniref:helix-turn-helix domain-containing protein n=1 Tax=Clostridium baratii TaxID=1561 RepID=UPI00290E8D0C|nr:helix-turn-helix domain-containing protein [Clostridium baratii]MDU4912867.1 helix-turn-helix domain-containing protein [Clostridium baratii]